MDDKLMVIGTHVFTATDDLYQIVDFLNRNLKDKDVIFGLSKVQDETNKMMLILYRS
jgi:F420-0:gamma-glutamyl ligase